MVKLIKKTIKIFIIFVVFTSVSHASSTMTFRALIGEDITGCDVILPETTLNFKPLQGKNIIGPVSTFQINKLSLQLFCEEQVRDIVPSITLKGSTPYLGNDTVFLNGEPNGVGFMVRRGSEQPPLNDFYNKDEAIKNNNTPINLNTLGNANNYYNEESLWIGLVGPVSSPIKSGPFSATLIINVVFR
ncbi:hypothetical protein [Marinospirillum sp.]|uniref:hypothetical protein n=1 Tax=Marinospirillum sp. TaxID=2183934 RepID=UPI003A897768